jgi:hypothetical protein
VRKLIYVHWMTSDTPLEAAARAAKVTMDGFGMGKFGLGLAEDVARAALTAAIEALPSEDGTTRFETGSRSGVFVPLAALRAAMGLVDSERAP